MVFWKNELCKFCACTSLNDVPTCSTTKAGTHEGNCREINGKPRSTIRPCKSNVMKQAANVKGYLFSFTSADVQHEQAAHC